MLSKATDVKKALPPAVQAEEATIPLVNDAETHNDNDNDQEQQ